MIKNTIKAIALTLTVAAASASCARVASSSTVDTKEFDAWVYVNKQDHPEYLWEETTLGSYILCDENRGIEIIPDAEKMPYLRVNYTARDLDNNVYLHNDPILSQQLGTYKEGYNYEPRVWLRGEGNMSAGVDEVVSGMTLGEKVKVVVPSWLATTQRMAESKLYKYILDGTSYIYDIEIVECVADIYQYQIDTIKNYLAKTYPGIYSEEDTLLTGLYYVQLQEPSDTTTIEKSSTVMINYSGRTLNRQVFDTTIEDTAKVYNIYSSSTTYEEAQINWGEDYSSLTMGTSESSVIEGFARGVRNMKVGEKGVVAFYSALGYGTDDTNSYIPAYSPLVFEIEIVSKE